MATRHHLPATLSRRSRKARRRTRPAVAALLRQSGNSAQATAAEQRILSQNLGKRADLSCEAAPSRVREALATEGIDQAALVFHAQLRTVEIMRQQFAPQTGSPLDLVLKEMTRECK
jgi:hypothetical protein